MEIDYRGHFLTQVLNFFAFDRFMTG